MTFPAEDDVRSRRDALGDALELLRLFRTSRSGVPGLVSDAALAPVEALFRDAGYHDADVPRLVLVGEFKSGKSTLLNALLGEDVAAVDFL